MSWNKRTRVLVIIAVAFGIASSVILSLFAIGDAVSFFVTPSEIVMSGSKNGRLYRVGGYVENDTVSYKSDGSIEFYVTDHKESIAVQYKGILPDLFSEGEGIVVEGYYNGDTFQASLVLAKHDEKYVPRGLE